MNSFWEGFEKRSQGSVTPEKNLEELSVYGKKWEADGRKKRWAYLGIPAAAIGAHFLKHPVARAGATALGIGSGIAGYAGERQLGYGKGLQTIAKHVKGEKVSPQEWDQLIMNNPSGSLITHVHPEHRPGLIKKWEQEYSRFHRGG